MKRSPLKTYARLERRTPLRSIHKPFPGKGDPGTATAASGAVPVSLDAPKFPKPSVEARKAKSRPPGTRVRESAPVRRRGTTAVVEAVISASPLTLALRTVRPVLPHPSNPDLAVVQLTRGYVATINASNAELVGQWNWSAYVKKASRTVYAVRSTRDRAAGIQRSIQLHKFLWESWGRPPTPEIDHVDGDVLNNTQDNLRAATHGQNRCNNPRQRNNSSGYKGVGFDGKSNKWRAQIQVNGKRIRIGTFDTPQSAAEAYTNRAAKEFGEFARTESVNGTPMFPKPAPRAKAARAPMKRRPMRKGARGTKHSRRQREFGRMAFYSSLWCMLRDISRGGRVPPDLNEVTQACDGPIEVAHLGDRGATGTGGWRRAPDAKTAPLCRHHHRGIDGRVGGKAPWYVALGREGQRELRADLVLFAGYYWDGLTPDQRAEWDRIAAERFASQRAA